MSGRSRTVVVIGQGYVGLPLAMRAVEVGYEVVGLDLDRVRVDALNAGRSFVEDIDGATVQAALDSGKYRASTDYGLALDFGVAVITVPTPLKETLPDLSFIESAARSLASLLTAGATVILESTTYPGTTEELLVPLLEEGSGLRAGKDFFVGYSPERIDPGNPRWNFVNTPKVVSGIDPDSLERVDDFYSSLVERTVPVSSPKEAELTKLLENTFRHVNIALVNELAVFADELDVNVWESIDAAATKPFGFMKFTPGPGVGGHCLPVDPSYLSWQVRRTLGKSFRFVELANDINENMPAYVVQRVIELLNNKRKSLNGSTVLLAGIAYKKNSGDSRESPALRIIELLNGYGAVVHAADPFVVEARWPKDVERRELTESAVSEADLVIVVTDHDQFDFGMLEQQAAQGGVVVFDTRNRIPHESVHRL
ncbi:nucleotide sugar dehydrogenase [Microbacterium sp. SSW1-49]|uniref:Nucleotide sugar dehydrogenase n=1 Tax=Microbacterium croceum TaxID=2851645 RepID=A0ABT0FCY2_9MICO|nr:nucleotide sugar dehydrogenase [Microbacterium croceum]MCK2035917.1 nucleotide sugar dehydrogenase [Microbacterium croceum]